MSLVATVLFKEPSFGTWVHTFGWQFPDGSVLGRCSTGGPLSRFIFRAYPSAAGIEACAMPTAILSIIQEESADTLTAT